MHTLFRLSVLALLTVFLVPEPVHAQLQEVRQTVFGMDCAPCAYALERRLGRFEGAKDVTVSLNEGQAVVLFQNENGVRLDALRATVRDAGFDPRETTLRVAGTLRQEEGRWVLVTPSGERFHVESAAGDAIRTALRARAGRRVVVTGRVGGVEPSESGWTLSNVALAS